MGNKITSTAQLIRLPKLTHTATFRREALKDD